MANSVFNYKTITILIKAFIKLRFKQIYRSIKGIGLIRFVFLIVLVGFLGFGLFIQTAQKPNSYLNDFN